MGTGRGAGWCWWQWRCVNADIWRKRARVFWTVFGAFLGLWADIFKILSLNKHFFLNLHFPGGRVGLPWYCCAKGNMFESREGFFLPESSTDGPTDFRARVPFWISSNSTLTHPHSQARALFYGKKVTSSPAVNILTSRGMEGTEMALHVRNHWTLLVP